MNRKCSKCECFVKPRGCQAAGYEEDIFLDFRIRAGYEEEKTSDFVSLVATKSSKKNISYHRLLRREKKSRFRIMGMIRKRKNL